MLLCRRPKSRLFAHSAWPTSGTIYGSRRPVGDGIRGSDPDGIVCSPTMSHGLRSSAGAGVTGQSGVLAVTAPPRWQPSLFGVVPAGSVRRRPGDVVQLILGLLLIAGCFAVTNNFAARPDDVYSDLTDLPAWIIDVSTWLFLALQCRGSARHRRRPVDQPQLRVGAQARGGRRGRRRRRIGCRRPDRCRRGPTGCGIDRRTAVGGLDRLARRRDSGAARGSAVPRSAGPAHRQGDPDPCRDRCCLRRDRSDPVDPDRARHRMGGLGGHQPRAGDSAGNAVAIVRRDGPRRVRTRDRPTHARRRPIGRRDSLRRCRPRRQSGIGGRDRPGCLERPAVPQADHGAGVPRLRPGRVGGAVGAARTPRLSPPHGCPRRCAGERRGDRRTRRIA